MDIKSISMILAIGILLFGCEGVDVSNLTGEQIKTLSENAVICNAPYMRFGVSCCLDNDNNTICDKDESVENSNEANETTLPTNDELICNSPYMRMGRECCLDANINNICDNDEADATEDDSKDEFVFLKSDACTTSCDQIEPIARQYAEKANLFFRKVKFPQPVEIPGYFVLKGGESTVLTGIENQDLFTVQMCDITNNAEICRAADAAREHIRDEEQSQQNEQAEQQQEALTGLPKKPIPHIDLFVMSHCPYGTQIEKGMIPVAELLGDKIDLDVKFVYYAMHGEKEVLEQANQYCIQKEQNGRFIPYLKCFLEAGNGDECLDTTGIDKAQLETCVAAADEEFDFTEILNDQSKWLNGRFPLFNTHKTDNEKYTVGGSPTLVINGLEVSSGRDSASLLAAVCSGFETEPTECSHTLNTASPSPGFGYNAGTATDASCG